MTNVKRFRISFSFGILILALLSIPFQKSIAAVTSTDSQIIEQKIWHYQKDKRPFKPVNVVVLVGGCFDVFHYGHLAFLQAAKKQGNHLVVALESDDSILSYKKRAPVHTAQQRAEILANLSIVDEVIILSPLKGYDDYAALVTDIHPSIIAVTEGDPQKKNKEKQMAILNGKVIVVTPLIPHLSSSKILKGFHPVK